MHSMKFLLSTILLLTVGCVSLQEGQSTNRDGDQGAGLDRAGRMADGIADGTAAGRDAGAPGYQRIRSDSNLPLEKVIEIAVNNGGETLADARRLITRRKRWASAHRVLEAAIANGLTKYDDNRLANTVTLYQGSPMPASVQLFQRMISSGRSVARQLGWQMAGALPSRALAQAIDRELTRAIMDNDESTVLIPQMAVAVASNKVRGAYTLLRQGLMSTGEEAFAVAMANLAPVRASNDFIDYLALAPADELRQLTQNSVNVYTCLIILKHLQSRPAPISHPNLESLVFYSVSRNIAMADLAQAALEVYLPRDRAQLAIMMARLPQWTQIAFIESVRRRKSPAVTLLLSELKKISSSRDVVEEVDEFFR